jgi:CHAT domain-containing protein
VHLKETEVHAIYTSLFHCAPRGCNRTIIMDFESFFAACGRSLFAEEYRGDFESAQNELNSCQVNLNSPENHATYLRSKIFFSTLTGRLSSAYDALNDLRSLLEDLPAHWGLRYTTSKGLIDYNRRYPPCIRFRHEPNVPSEFPMVTNIDGHGKIGEDLMQNVRKYFGSGQPKDQGFCVLLQGILYFPMQLRSITAHFHPLLRQNPETEVLPSSDLVLAQTANAILATKDKAVTMKAGPVVLYFERLITELHLAFASPSSSSVLCNLYHAYETEGDITGMANCKLLEGDNHISPSFSSPIALNSVLFDASTGTGEDDRWDSIEAKITFQPSKAAEDRYEEALALFKRAKCQRGEAAVLLRQGCYLHMIASGMERRGDRIEVLKNASVKLNAALKLFGLDEINSQIVKTHLILLDISMGGDPSNSLQRAAEIGHWGVEARNENISHASGLLMVRYARREWQTYSRLDSARVAYECAHACFHALQGVVPSAQTVLARARMQADMYQFTAARILCRDAIKLFEDVLQWYQTRIAKLPHTDLGSSARHTYLVQKASMISTFGSRITQIYLRIEAQEELEDWDAQYTRLRDTDDSFLVLKNSVEDSDAWIKKIISEYTVYIKYCIAKIKRDHSLEKGDVDLAEKYLHDFIDEASSLEKSDTREGFRLLACRFSGDLPKARQILDSMTDSDLFHESLDRFSNGEGLRDLFPIVADNILSHCILAEDWSRGQKLITVIEQIDSAYLTQPTHDNWVDYSYRLESLGIIAFHNGQFELAFRLLLQCRSLIELRRSQTSDVDAKLGASVGSANDVFSSLARICITCSRFSLPRVQLTYDHGHPDGLSWDEHALLFMEEGRARVILDSLQSIDQSQVEEVRKKEISELIYKQRTLFMLRSLPLRTPVQNAELRKLEEDLSNASLEPGLAAPAEAQLHEGNLKILPKLIFQSIPDDALAVETTFDARGCISIAITRDGIQRHFMSSVRYTDMRRLAMRYMQTMQCMTGYRTRAEEYRKQSLRMLSQEISAILLTPFEDLILSKRHVIFSGSDPLTAFPFASLIFDNKPLIWSVAVSQVPSMTVMYHLSKDREPIKPTLSAFTKAPTLENEPSDSHDSSADSEADLHMSNIEAVNISSMFSTWPIEASTLSRKRFREYLQGRFESSPHTGDRGSDQGTGSTILHIGTHGNYDTRYPLLSSISIGEDFRVLDMSEIYSSQTRLMVFAACLSGLGKSLGSEVMGFTHVVLGTGCKAYVGSLWKIEDFGSMCLMTLFYRNLRRHRGNGKQPNSFSLAECLRDAQLEIMSWKTRNANLFFDDLIQLWKTVAIAGDSTASPPPASPSTLDPSSSSTLPTTAASPLSPSGLQEERAVIMSIPETQFLLRTRKMIISQLDFESPFFWAPFVLVGCGDYRFDNSDH